MKILKYVIDVPNIYVMIDIENPLIIPQNGDIINIDLYMIKDEDIRNKLEDWLENNILIAKRFSVTYINNSEIIQIGLFDESEYNKYQR